MSRKTLRILMAASVCLAFSVSAYGWCGGGGGGGAGGRTPANGIGGKVIRFATEEEFTVGGKTLPAGSYVIRNFGNSLQVQSRDGRHTAMAFREPIESPKAEGTRLIFKRYGDRRFLSQVWEGSTGVQLPPGKEEREQAKKISAITEETRMR